MSRPAFIPVPEGLHLIPFLASGDSEPFLLFTAPSVCVCSTVRAWPVKTHYSRTCHCLLYLSGMSKFRHRS